MDASELYLKDIKNFPLLSPEEEKELGEKSMAGDKHAKRKLIDGNLRLVVRIAKRSLSLHGRATLMDLISYGNVGLGEAVENFNPSKGKFATFASHYIRGAIDLAPLKGTSS